MTRHEGQTFEFRLKNKIKNHELVRTINFLLIFALSEALMTCPIYIYSILFSLLPPLFILGANGKVFFSMSITKTKKCHREMHAHVVCVFFYRFNYKNPQHNFHSETTHIIYVYTQQYLSSRKHQYAIIFHSLKAYCG